MTVKDFIVNNPGMSFNMMTPLGYVCLSPEEAESLD